LSFWAVPQFKMSFGRPLKGREGLPISNLYRLWMRDRFWNATWAYQIHCQEIYEILTSSYSVNFRHQWHSRVHVLQI